MFFNTKLLAATLALVAAASTSAVELESRAGSVLIGWRVVTKEEAASYKANGNSLTIGPPNAKVDANMQMGRGIYTSPSAGEWAFKADPWFCAIQADKDAWEKANKAWVPKAYDGCQRLWEPAKMSDIDTYLKTLDPKFTSANTFMFSKIFKFEHMQQMMIPPGFVNNKDFKINVQCVDSTDTKGLDLLKSTYGTVDYSAQGAKGSAD